MNGKTHYLKDGVMISVVHVGAEYRGHTIYAQGWPFNDGTYDIVKDNRCVCRFVFGGVYLEALRFARKHIREVIGAPEPRYVSPTSGQNDATLGGINDV